MRSPLEKDWRDKIQAGDIVLFKGTERIVRKACYGKNGLLTYVYFTILRCSWTRRPYTLYQRSELKNNASPTDKKYKFKAGSIDIELWRDIADHRRQKLHCCDVVGLIR